MGFLRRKKKENTDGTDWQSGAYFGYPSSGGSPGLVPSGVISGPGISSADLASVYPRYAVPGPGSSLSRDSLRKALIDSSAAMKSQLLYGLFPPMPIFSPGPVSNTPPPLSTESREDPVRAWKRVYLHQSPYTNTWGMVSRASFESYGGGIAQAKCTKFSAPQIDFTHCSPGLDCTCGFYGWKKAEFEECPPSILSPEPWLEVDFYGKVIEHEWGYRAEYQQPLRLYVDESFFEFVGGKQVDHLNDWMVTSGVWSIENSLVPADSYGVPVAHKPTCLNPQTLAQQIGIPVVVNDVEFK